MRRLAPSLLREMMAMKVTSTDSVAMCGFMVKLHAIYGFLFYCYVLYWMLWLSILLLCFVLDV